MILRLHDSVTLLIVVTIKIRMTFLFVSSESDSSVGTGDSSKFACLFGEEERREGAGRALATQVVCATQIVLA